MTEIDRELMIRVVAMPADTNASGDIFGGWLLSQMDLAAGIAGKQLAHSRVVTVALDGVIFHRPVFVGDIITCYTQLTRIGRTSATFHVSTYVERTDGGAEEHVCEGHFTMVAIGDDRKPIPIRRGSATT